MPKTIKPKLSALRGPKLFGALCPRLHTTTRTEWGHGAALAVVQDDGRTWSFRWLRGMGRAYETRGVAKRALERSIREDRKITTKLGCVD